MKRWLPLLSLMLGMMAPSSEAAVYCKRIGVPKGCVPGPAPVPRLPAAATPGVAAPVMRAPAGAVSAPYPGNVNGGVNRAGRRR